MPEHVIMINIIPSPTVICESLRTCPEPRHLCRFIGVRHVAIPAFRSSELSGTPGVTSCFEDILLLDGGVPRPNTSCRQSRLFQESLHCQPPCAGERLRQSMKGGPAIASSPVSVVEEPQNISHELKRRRTDTLALPVNIDTA
jgi:hypothetical protein